jgi:hypothetical protein
MFKGMSWVVDVETSPNQTREEVVVLLHESLESFYVSFSHDQDEIERPMVLTWNQRSVIVFTHLLEILPEIEA